MVIYVDILLCVNALADYLLLLVAAKLCRFPLSRARAAIGAAVGGLFSLFMLLPPLPAAALTPLQLGSALLCCAAAFGIKPLRTLLKSTAALYLCSTALAGILLLLQSKTNGVLYANGSFYADISPLFLFGSTVLFYLLLSGAQRLFFSPSQAHTAQLTLKAGENAIACSCICDSGNTLTDPISGSRAVLLRESLAAALLSEEQLSAARQTLRSETPAVYPKGFCLLPCSTVAGSRTLPAFLLPAGCACIKAAGKTHRLGAVALAICEDEYLGDAQAIAYPP